MKRFLIILLFGLPFFSGSQNYIDLFSITYGQTSNNNFEDVPGSTSINYLDLDLTIPIPINDKYTIITGPIHNSNRLEFFPNSDFSNIFSTTFKIGLATNHSDRWTSNFIFLPRLSSDFQNITSNDIQYGGIAIINYTKAKNFAYKFGVYSSTEAFGVIISPFFGWNYLSKNERFAMDVLAPISFDINYSFNKFTLGIDYNGVGRSYNINENNAGLYAHQSSLKFTNYAQLNLLNKSVLLRAKWGYATNNFELFQQGDRVDLALPGFQIGDNRNQINSNIDASFLIEFEAIYRFTIPQKKN